MDSMKIVGDEKKTKIKAPPKALFIRIDSKLAARIKELVIEHNSTQESVIEQLLSQALNSPTFEFDVSKLRKKK